MSTPSRSPSPMFALLIGIGDYSAHDESAGDARGASDLPSAANDTLAFYRLSQELGIAPENIHVLASPARSRGDSSGARPGYAGPATLAEIEAQLGWLARQLGRAEGEPAKLGLLAYSGHGDFQGEEIALCPSDTRKRRGAGRDEDLENVLGLDRVRRIFEGVPGALDGLTVLLESSHAGTEAAWGPGKRTSLTGRSGRLSERSAQGVGASTWMAAAPGEVARHVMFGQEPHGAFAWALSVAGRTWRCHSDRGTGSLTISQGDLLGRAQKLLEALSIPQAIAVRGPRSAGELCFFRLGDVASALRATNGFDQMDPDVGHGDFTLYTLTLGASTNPITAQVLSVGVSCSSLGYVAGQEYWNVSQEFINASSTAASLSITGQSGHWGTPAAAPSTWGGSASSPVKSASVRWSLTSTSPGTAMYAAGSSATYAVRFGGSPSSPAVDWFIGSSSQPAEGTYIVAPGGMSLSPTEPSHGGQSWYRPE